MGDKETLPVSNGNAEEATVQNDANSRVQEDLDVDRAKALEDEIKDTFKGREKNRLICKGFMAKQKFTRKDLLRVPQVYTSYTALCEANTQLMNSHDEWLTASGYDEGKSESSDFNDQLKSHNFDATMDRYIQETDDLEAQFKKLVQEFPDDKGVKAHLKEFIHSPVVEHVAKDAVTLVNKGSSSSSTNAERAIKKIPLVQKAVEK